MEVFLKVEEDILTLAVVDNGQGFNTTLISETEALGVAGMSERAGLVGGSLEVLSQPERGTQVYFKVPINGQGSK